MKRIEAVVTSSDGKIHLNQAAAIAHLQKVYESAKMEIGDELLNISGRQLIQMWLHNNVEKLAQLARIKADFKMEIEQ